MTQHKPHQGDPWINEIAIDIPKRTITLSSFGKVVDTYPVERTEVNISVVGYDPLANEPEVHVRPLGDYNEVDRCHFCEN